MILITWDGYNVNTHRHDFRHTTRPIAFPPGVQPNFPTAYPINRYGAVILPWERQPTPVNIPNGYQLKTPFTKTKDTKKDY